MTDTPDAFRIRRMRPGEAEIIREWANGEGWNPGLYDADCFYRTDPGGFFLGELGGEPIACISCVAYDDTFGFLGQYIVRPEFRGKGYGIQIWRAGMEYLGGRNVGLDGVVAQQDNYRKSGFQFAYGNIRYRGTGGGERARDVIPLAEVPFEEVCAFDREQFPAPRPGFLRNWIALTDSTALACVRDGRLAGYGVIRPCVEGMKIGPLFADGPEIADAILHSLLAAAPGVPAVIDMPDATANPHAQELVRRHGLTEVFSTARMYTKAAPTLRLDRVYGVTSLELG